MKRNLALTLWLAGSLALLSCTEESPFTPMTDDGPGIRCRLTGTYFRIGSADALAAPDEKPGWTRFTHDVWMDRTEMTQAEYRTLVGGNPSRLVGDSLPVTNVSWFDAVLAANARSRRDKFDSVYEYSSVQPDASGNATGLTGLTVHLDRTGWRLPTEAEWEAAARAGTTTPWTWGTLSDSVQAAAGSWYQKNAEGRPHPVASRSPNAWGFHDMAGNVMEWVNDWKGSFPKDTIDDFAGPESPGDVADVPLKGGAYAYGISHLRPSSRTATYAAYRSARAEYVGFRLARGAFAARYTSSSGQVVNTPPVTLVRTDVARIVGSWEARLVFVNRAGGKGTLTWVDYAEASPVARSLPDKDPVFHPVISPDGRWVAWSTVLEGSTQAGRIKVRRLARNDTVVKDLGEGAIPRWWVNGTDTFLVRGNAMDNLASGWSSTKTTAQRWSNGVLSGAVQTWVSAGNYHDGRSGQYLYTGYRRLRQHDLLRKTDRVLFTGPGNGKTSGDTSQVCNVSAAPDSSGRVMFLDFGYAGTSSVVGRSYGIHEVAFISDNQGAIKRQIVSPAGEAQWEHMEWSNSARWAVSGAIDGTGAYRNLYLVDIDAGSSTRIASGEQLWQPSLWTGQSVSDELLSVLDSLFQYGIPRENPMNGEAVRRMLRFWQNQAGAEALYLGSSHIGNGILPGRIRSVTGINLGLSGSLVHGESRFLTQYALPNLPKLKVVVLSLMPGWLFKVPLNSQWELLSVSMGGLHDQAHGYWAHETFPEQWGSILRTRMDASSVETLLDDFGGERNVPAAGWGGTVETSDMSEGRTVQDTLFQTNLTILRHTIGNLSSRGIKTILVSFPQSPSYRTTGFAGRYGPSWETYHEILDTVRSWESKFDGYAFYDAYKDGNHDYGDGDAANWDHLSSNGAVKFSTRLDSVIAKMLDGP